MTIKPAYDSAEGNIKEDYMEFFSAFPLYQYKFPGWILLKGGFFFWFFFLRELRAEWSVLMGSNLSWSLNNDQSNHDQDGDISVRSAGSRGPGTCVPAVLRLPRFRG